MKWKPRRDRGGGASRAERGWSATVKVYTPDESLHLAAQAPFPSQAAVSAADLRRGPCAVPAARPSR